MCNYYLKSNYKPVIILNYLFIIIKLIFFLFFSPIPFIGFIKLSSSFITFNTLFLLLVLILVSWLFIDPIKFLNSKFKLNQNISFPIRNSFTLGFCSRSELMITININVFFLLLLISIFAKVPGTLYYLKILIRSCSCSLLMSVGIT